MVAREKSQNRICRLNDPTMKLKTLLFPPLLLLLLVGSTPLLADEEDDRQRKLIREQQKQFQGRKAMREKRDLENLDFTEIDRKAAAKRRIEQERLNTLIQNFDERVLTEVAKARRTYDATTVRILQSEAEKRYQQDPENLTYIYARIYIHLFNCDTLLYRTHITELMYERPKLKKQRHHEAQIGVTLVEKLLVNNPKDAELWRLRGLFLSCFKEKRFSKEKFYTEAEASLKKSIELSEDTTQAKLSLALFYFNQPKKQGRNVEAATLLAREVLKRDPKWVDAYLVIGRSYQEKYKYDEAYQEFKKGLALEPKNPELTYYLAVAKKDRKRFRKLMES